MSYIPSQTLDVVRPMRGERSGVDFPSQAEDRLYTLIPIYHNGTMQKIIPVVIPISQIYCDIECHKFYQLYHYTKHHHRHYTITVNTTKPIRYGPISSPYSDVSQCVFNTVLYLSVPTVCLARDIQ